VILGEASSTNYLLAFTIAVVTTAVATPLVRRFALARGILDRPVEDRKIHRQPIAYLGGLAIFAGFLVAVTLFMPLSRQLVALLLGCAILVSVGVVDDIRGLSPWTKLVFQFGGERRAGGRHRDHIDHQSAWRNDRSDVGEDGV
jgi:UDP-N-acetylmuramyl pentapeptide phosphotransferase/UDP-N-acetylglucosamine-1-phosphate transferase